MNVLGIETSCDETAAAVVRDDGLILSDVVRSQIAAHAPYGGVVPEIAARDHMRAIGPVIELALSEADISLAELDGIAVSNRPGLIGALLVGVQAAKGLAWGANKPLVGVDHLVGHLMSVFLLNEPEAATPPPQFPFIGLLVSGGHTALYHCRGPHKDQIDELGGTRDDAVGEAFDKVAKLLNLGYPGGPIVDKLAAQGEAARARIKLKPPMAGNSLEFSFSGIKSAIARHVASEEGPRNQQEIADLCAAFQEVVVGTLVKKTLTAAQGLALKTVIVTGGVAANRGLRQTMATRCQELDIRLVLPAFKSCTDNAAMIAYAGALKLAAGERDDMTLSPVPRTELPRLTRKGSGKRAARAKHRR